MRACKALIVAALLLSSAVAHAATTAVKFGKLWDGHRTIPNAVVMVDDDKILSVTANGRIPAGTKILDLSRYTGIPGLIDSHTHMTFYWDRSTGATPLHQPPRHVAVTVFLAQENAKKTLEAGVTTVRDLNGFEGADLALRDLINRGAVTGPRMFVSGAGIRSMMYRRPGVTDPVAEAVKLTKSLLASGVDWIKIYASTGIADDLTGEQTVSYDEMKAIIDTAHAAGRKVAVHSYGPAAAKDAIRAGADTLEHATDMDDSTIAELVAKNVWYSPTINHNQHYLDHADDVYKFTPEAKANFRDFIQRNFATAQKAYRAGARILVGSDAVYTAFGTNMQELSWLVKLGMTPEQALQSATILPAQMLGQETRLGTVAPGYLADMVAVEGDPLNDISTVLNNVRWVMKSGAVVVHKTGPARVR